MEPFTSVFRPILDVYKRQAHPYLLGQINTCVEAAQNAQDAADAALEAVNSIAFTINVVPTQNGTPVSYTHPDVYKRQGIHNGAGGQLASEFFQERKGELIWPLAAALF